MSATNGHAPPVMNADQRLNKFQEIVANVLYSRAELMRRFTDPRRDIEAECGYPDAIAPKQFKDMYDREALAARVVEVFPKETWQHQPEIYEDEDEDTETEFEKDWALLDKNLRGGDYSWFDDNIGSPTYEALRRLDILTGIGHYAVMLLGIDDGKNLREPIDGFPNDGQPVGTAAQYNQPLFNHYENEWFTQNDCGTGEGGFKPGNTCAKGGGGVSIEKGKQIGMVTEPAVKGYKKSPGDFTIAAQAAAYYARKNNTEEMLLVPGNSFGHKVYHIAKISDDITSMGSAFIGGQAEQSIAIVLKTGEVFQAKATRKKLTKNELEMNLAPNGFKLEKKKGKKRRLLYLRSFDESLAEITRYEDNASNPRYGQPIEYNITLNDPTTQHSGIGLNQATVTCHWSRVIHCADNLGSSEIFGLPRMQQVFNRLCDTKKLYSGSAEMYWRGAFPGFSLETNPQLGGDVDLNLENIRDQMQNYMQGLQRYFTLTGMSAKSLAPQVVDPTPQIKVQIEAICILLGIPMRIFMGSERGELASGQDDSTWNGRLKDRQQNFVTPRLLVPFTDRLIRIGVLAEPAVGYKVDWPDLDALQPLEQAQLAVSRTDAMSKYVAGGLDALMQPLDFLTREMGYDEEEATSILEASIEAIEAQQEAQDEIAADQPSDPTVPGRPQAAQPGQPPAKPPLVPSVNAAELLTNEQWNKLVELINNKPFLSDAARKAFFAKFGSAYAKKTGDVGGEQQRGPGGKFGKGREAPEPPAPPKPEAKPKGPEKTEDPRGDAFNKVKRSRPTNADAQNWLDEWTGEGGGLAEYEAARDAGKAWVGGNKDSTLDAVYGDTQAKLKAAGVTEVKAFRGIRLDDNHPLMKDLKSGKLKAGDEIEIEGNAFASWSADTKAASSFAQKSQASTSGEKGSRGLVFERVVAAQDVVAGYMTQPGFIEAEQEVIARNTKPTMRIRISEIH